MITGLSAIRSTEKLSFWDSVIKKKTSTKFSIILTEQIFQFSVDDGYSTIELEVILDKYN